MKKSFIYRLGIICKTFTYLRLFNLIKIRCAYFFSLVLRRPIVWGFPPILMIEPTNYCNLQCPMCPSGSGQLTRPKGYLTFEDFKKIIDQVHRYTFMLLLWNQGEPFLHKDLCLMINYAHQKKMFVIVSTNANYLPCPQQIIHSQLDRLIISLDGITQETYNKYRVNGSLEKVLQNVKLLVQAKKEFLTSQPFLVWQFIVMKHNEHEIPQLQKLVDQYEIDELSLKTVQIYTPDDLENFLPLNPKYQRYKVKNEQFELKYTLRNKCFRAWHQPVINWDGEMCICCFDKDNQYKIGNCREKPIIELWKSKEYMCFRNMILHHRQKFNICKNCGESIHLTAP